MSTIIVESRELVRRAETLVTSLRSMESSRGYSIHQAYAIYYFHEQVLNMLSSLNKEYEKVMLCSELDELLLGDVVGMLHALRNVKTDLNLLRQEIKRYGVSSNCKGNEKLIDDLCGGSKYGLRNKSNPLHTSLLILLSSEKLGCNWKYIISSNATRIYTMLISQVFQLDIFTLTGLTYLFTRMGITEVHVVPVIGCIVKSLVSLYFSISLFVILSEIYVSKHARVAKQLERALPITWKHVLGKSSLLSRFAKGNYIAANNVVYVVRDKQELCEYILARLCKKLVLSLDEQSSIGNFCQQFDEYDIKHLELLAKLEILAEKYNKVGELALENIDILNFLQGSH